MKTKRSPNDLIHWLHLLRYDDEADIGMVVALDGKHFVAQNVREYGAAWRAGIKTGEQIKSYRLDVHSREKIAWAEDTEERLNNLPALTAFGVQVQLSEPPKKPYTTRSVYIKKKKLRKNELARGKIVGPRGASYDFDRLLVAWDKAHFKGPTETKMAAADEDAEIKTAAADESAETKTATVQMGAAVEDPTAADEATAAGEPSETKSAAVQIGAAVEEPIAVGEPAAADEPAETKTAAVQMSTTVEETIAAGEVAAADAPADDQMLSADEPEDDDESSDSYESAGDDEHDDAQMLGADELNDDDKADDDDEPDDSQMLGANEIAETKRADEPADDQMLGADESADDDEPADAQMLGVEESGEIKTSDEPADNSLGVLKSGGNETDAISVNSDILVDRPAATLTFRQVRGPYITAELNYGWVDTLESPISWIPDLVVEFMGFRIAQLVSYDRLRVLSSHYYTNAVLKKKYNKWITPTPPIVCMPICKSLHWTLAVVVTIGNRAHVLYFDSLGVKNTKKQPRLEVVQFLKKAWGASDTERTVQASLIKVPIQQNGNDCGLHVISHLETIVSIMVKTSDEDLVKAIQAASFDKILTRTDLREETKDAFEEVLYHSAYWGMYTLQGKNMWWPCRRITKRFAKKIHPKSPFRLVVPIIWFKKGTGDPLWIHPSNLKPLHEKTLAEVISDCPFNEDEIAELTESYRQATN